MTKCVIDPIGNFRQQLDSEVKSTKKNFTDKLEALSLTLREYDGCIRKLADEIEQMSERIENISSVEQDLIGLLNFPEAVLK